MLTGFFRSLTRSLTLSLAILSLGSIGGALGVSIEGGSIIDPEYISQSTLIFEVTYAADTAPATPNNTNEAAEWIKALNGLIAFVSMLYVPLSLMGGWLLSSEWTYGDLIGIRPVFHSLWVFVSNFVYVAFAGMLVIVAIANIFGQSDSYAIKKMLPRFIIGVIMVPLTWFGVSAILSLTNYATAVVLRLPAETITAAQKAGPETEYRIEYPKKCTFNFTGTGSNPEIFACDKEMGSGTFSEVLTNSSRGAYGILPYYAYSIFDFGEMTNFKNQLSAQTPEGNAYSQGALILTTLGKIGIQLALKVVFFIVFMVILIMLVFVMLLRTIRMWFYIIFSPLFALRFFLGDKVDKESPLNSFNFTDFIGLALVPVYVSAALGFGLMFLTVFKDRADTGTITSDIISTKSGDGKTESASGFYIFGTTEVVIQAFTGGAGGTAQDVTTITQKSLAELLSSLLTPILGIIVLWLAVLAASKSSTITKEAVSGFENAGKMVGDVAKKVPGMVPIPGSGAFTRNKQPISFNQATKIPNIIKEISDAKHNAEYQEVRAAFGLSDKIDDLTKSINGLSQPLDALKQMAIAQQGKSVGDQATSHNNRQNIKATAKQLRINISDIQADLDSGTEAGYLKFWEAFAKKLQTDPNFGRLTPDQQRTINAVATRASTINIANAQTALAGGAQSKNGILNQTGQSFDTSTNKLKFSYQKDQNDSYNAVDIDIPPSATTDSQIKTLIENQAGELPDVEIQKLVKVVQNARGTTGTPTPPPPPPGNP